MGCSQPSRLAPERAPAGVAGHVYERAGHLARLEAEALLRSRRVQVEAYIAQFNLVPSNDLFGIDDFRPAVAQSKDAAGHRLPPLMLQRLLATAGVDHGH